LFPQLKVVKYLTVEDNRVTTSAIDHRLPTSVRKVYDAQPVMAKRNCTVGIDLNALVVWTSMVEAPNHGLNLRCQRSVAKDACYSTHRVCDREA